jgi:L-alanine-DL-glutamate epimerase-like enolase superfamily enzyme
VRAYGLREIGSGDTVAVDRQGRGSGKQRPRRGLDIATLAALAPRSSRQAALAPALTAHVDVALLDLIGSVWGVHSTGYASGMRSGRARTAALVHPDEPYCAKSPEDLTLLLPRAREPD